MVEATDDSYLFVQSLTALQRNTLAMECFQFAYGWLTQWTKLMAYVLEPSSDPPAFADFESVTTTAGANSLNITTHCVALRLNELDFLRTLVDDPHAHYEELKEFIQHFTFPKFLRRPPIILLHKILKQNVVSKARALISLQPIKCADADKLDKILKTLIHRESGMPFEPNPDVLMLPTEFHGLDFPSIGHVNDAAAVNGLHCDLNHPIASYRMMACITLVDWTSTINNCINPLDGHSLSRTFAFHTGRILYSWIVAQDFMASSTPTLALKRTNLSNILPGTMSLSHTLKTIMQHLLDQLVPANNTL
jgi:hypothetical protein